MAYTTTARAEIIVARVTQHLAPAEITRMRSSLEIDLDMGDTHAINRAMRSLESHRLGYRSWMSQAEIDALSQIDREIRVQAPVAAPRTPCYCDSAYHPQGH